MNFSQAATAILLVGGLISIIVWPEAGLAWIAFFLACFMTSYVAMVLPHELGHALTAMALGMRLFTVEIGVLGRVLFEPEILGCEFLFRSVPLGGCVRASPKNLRFVRTKHFFVVAAGPMTNAVALVAVLWLIGMSREHAVLCWALAAFVFANIFKLAVGLFPRMVWMPGGRTPNDGLLLLRIFFMPDTALAAWHSSTLVQESLLSLARGRISDAEARLAVVKATYPNDASPEFIEPAIFSEQRRYREAREAYLRLLDKSDLSAAQKPVIQNNIAWADLMIGDESLLGEADRLSQAAIEEIPERPYVRGTRGSVLIELGQIEAGIPLLLQAMRENRRENSALNACYLAIAEGKRGNYRSAQQYLATAKRRDTDCPLLDRATSALERVVN